MYRHSSSDDPNAMLKRMKAEIEKTRADEEARRALIYGEDPPFKKGQTFRVAMGDGDGDEAGRFTARVESCSKYGGCWSVHVRWLTGPQRGKTTMLGPQFLMKMDTITLLGDIARVLEEDAEDEAAKDEEE